jgi:branched-chain amino acid transport system permease protein
MSDTALVLVQMLNGLQFGMMLFLFTAGLTLVLGVMNLVNLAHGSFFMIGAFVAAYVSKLSGSFTVGALAGLIVAFLVGIGLDLAAVRRLYARDHLDQVLVTFGLILIFNELARIIWGSAPLYIAIPPILDGSVELFDGVGYPIYRLFLIALGAVVASFLYFLIAKTKIGMLIRAGASNRELVESYGVDVRFLFTLIFGLGALLAALGGITMAPILSVESGMGDSVLILALVVIVIGGVGSIRGSFVAALVVGTVDTIGRAFLPLLLADILPDSVVSNYGSGLASMLVYIIMVVVLLSRPEGLFSSRRG